MERQPNESMRKQQKPPIGAGINAVLPNQTQGNSALPLIWGGVGFLILLIIVIVLAMGPGSNRPDNVPRPRKPSEDPTMKNAKTVRTEIWGSKPPEQPAPPPPVPVKRETPKDARGGQPPVNR